MLDRVTETAPKQKAEASLQAFGYRQELKRSLGLPALIVYGLVFINPTSPFSIFGIVFNLSHGMVPLVYVIGLGAMLFTASSYVTMSRAFPVAGSVYSYAGRGIGPTAGFIAGWALLLDYVLMPTLIYVLCAIAIEALAPGINALLHGVAGARLSTAPLFRADAFSSAVIFSALSVATLNFLGFDGISTLVEEARDGAASVGRALLWSVCLAAVLFISATWLTSLFVLDRTHFEPGPPTDGAFYIVAEIIGGSWFKAAASSKVLVAGVAVAAASQTATARLMYAMARDGRLPRALAHVHPERKVPQRAILFIATINLVTALIFANSFEMLTTLVCFGALVGFLMLHVSVLVHFRQRDSRRWGRHVIAPAVGAVIVCHVLWNMALDAQLVGVAWLSIGLGTWLLSRRVRA